MSKARGSRNPQSSSRGRANSNPRGRGRSRSSTTPARRTQNAEIEKSQDEIAENGNSIGVRERDEWGSSKPKVPFRASGLEQSRFANDESRGATKKVIPTTTKQSEVPSKPISTPNTSTFSRQSEVATNTPPRFRATGLEASRFAPGTDDGNTVRNPAPATSSTLKRSETPTMSVDDPTPASGVGVGGPQCAAGKDGDNATPDLGPATPSTPDRSNVITKPVDNPTPTPEIGLKDSSHAVSEEKNDTTQDGTSATIKQTEVLVKPVRIPLPVQSTNPEDNLSAGEHKNARTQAVASTVIVEDLYSKPVLATSTRASSIAAGEEPRKSTTYIDLTEETPKSATHVDLEEEIVPVIDLTKKVEQGNKIEHSRDCNPTPRLTTGNTSTAVPSKHIMEKLVTPTSSTRPFLPMDIQPKDIEPTSSTADNMLEEALITTLITTPLDVLLAYIAPLRASSLNRLAISDAQDSSNMNKKDNVLKIPPGSAGGSILPPPVSVLKKMSLTDYMKRSKAAKTESGILYQENNSTNSLQSIGLKNKNNGSLPNSKTTKPLPTETPLRTDSAAATSQPDSCKGCAYHCHQIKDCKGCVRHCPQFKSPVATSACNCHEGKDSHQTYCFHFILDKTFPRGKWKIDMEPLFS